LFPPDIAIPRGPRAGIEACSKFGLQPEGKASLDVIAGFPLLTLEFFAWMGGS